MNRIVFLIKCMSGGGAERVISILSNALVERDYHVTLVITHQTIAEANLFSVNPRVSVISVEDEVSQNSEIIKKILMLKARFAGKIDQIFLYKGDTEYLIEKYKVRNYEKVKWLKQFFDQHPKATIIAFLNDSIFLTLLSARKSNRVIISERGDPKQCLGSKTNVAFMYTMFEKADEVVFQSPDAMQWYRENTNVKGKVIFNPVKLDLPQPYVGKRQKKIVNFCRISPPKKLDTLIESFDRFVKNHDDYELYIFGDIDPAVPEYMGFVKETIASAASSSKIHLLPAQKDIHFQVLDYAMFISSSFFEGMSNSMLEAMAIGLPTICTDCPAGGARAIIKDHENGILVPVNDVEAMANAMKEVAENAKLAEKLSANGTKIREELKVDRIVDQWMEIIDD